MDILSLYKIRQNYIDALNEYGIKPLTVGHPCIPEQKCNFGQCFLQSPPDGAISLMQKLRRFTLIPKPVLYGEEFRFTGTQTNKSFGNMSEWQN